MIRGCCFVLLAAPLCAQTLFRPTRHAFLPPNAAAFATCVAVGDVDDDGDLDLVVGNAGAPDRLLRNDGRGRFDDVTAGHLPSLPGANSTCAIDLADIDGDGDLDLLLCVDGAASPRVLCNDGHGTFTDVTATAMPGVAFQAVGQIVGDLDGDGRPDWFVCDQPAAHLCLSDGAGRFTDVTESHLIGVPQLLGALGARGQAADLDGDGNLDLVVPAVPRPVVLHNLGGGVFVPAASPLPCSTANPTSVLVADLDGDGHPDLVLDGGATILTNLGDGTFVDATGTAYPAGPERANTPALLDLDGDGDFDLLSPTRSFHNDGAGHFLPRLLAQSLTFGVLDAAAGDFDGDGDFDLPGRPNFLDQVEAPLPPVRGNAYAIDVHVRRGATTFVVAMAALGEVVVPTPGYGLLRLDPASLVTLGAAAAAGEPLHFGWQLPGDPALAGVGLHYQAFLVDPVFGPRLSNTIGDVVQ